MTQSPIPQKSCYKCRRDQKLEALKFSGQATSDEVLSDFGDGAKI